MGRLPAFLTNISPVGETLDALSQGEALLKQEAAQRNHQLTVSTADTGLSLWEKDYSLDHDGSPETRRGRIRAAMAGGQTMTRRQMESLAVTVGGADRGAAEEDFARWDVTLYAIYDGRLPEHITALEQAVKRLQPAHLTVQVVPTMGLQTEHSRYLTLTGGCFWTLTASEGT